MRTLPSTRLTPTDAVMTFAVGLVHGTIAELAALDAIIEQHSQHWRLGRLAVIDRLILRMAVWELRHGTGHAARGRPE